MDLGLLRSFVTAAELEHIGKAAERLHISQSPLSRQIRRLETEVGMELFFRERQRVRLTESGKWLLSQAQKLLAHADRIADEADQRALGKTGTLSITFVSGAMSNGILPSVLRRFVADYPDVALELRNMRSTSQIEAVEAGWVDLGFISVASTSNALENTCIAEEPYLLAIPIAHHLSRKRHIAPADLHGIPWILLSHSTVPEEKTRFLAGCTRAGFVPEVVQQVTEPNTLLGLVDAGLGVGIVASSARHYVLPSIRFKTLPWLQLNRRIYLIRPRQGRQIIADRFASYMPSVKTRS